MAKFCVERAVVKGHHVYLSNLNVGDVYDCIPESNNVHDPCAMVVYNTNAGNTLGHLPVGFAAHIYRIFTELLGNVTILCEITGIPQPSHKPWPFVWSKGGGIIIPCQYIIFCQKENMDFVLYQLQQSLEHIPDGRISYEY